MLYEAFSPTFKTANKLISQTLFLKTEISLKFSLPIWHAQLEEG